MNSALMTLKILLPFGIYLEENEVSRVVVDTNFGSLGLLPRRLDCVAALLPGILSYDSKENGEKFIAIDEGILVKTDLAVQVSVRNAIGGKTLSQLQDAVISEFMNFSEEEKTVRQAFAKMESSFMQRLSELRNDR